MTKQNHNDITIRKKDLKTSKQASKKATKFER